MPVYPLMLRFLSEYVITCLRGDAAVKPKKCINIVYLASIILDLVIGFFLNKISQDGFDIGAPRNIIIFGVFGVLTIGYIVCLMILKNYTGKNPQKRLQKAFNEQGGYEFIVNEMKLCIEKRDYKNAKKLTKLANFIER